MKQRILLYIAALPLALLGPVALQAQESPISFDLRGGYSFPFGDFADNTSSDFGFGAGVVFNLTPMVGVYGGWGRDAFGCEVVGCGEDSKVNAQGFEAGAKFTLQTQTRAIPWAKAGLIWHTVEFDSGAFEFESDRNVGFQGAIGMDFPLGDVLSVSPALRAHFLDVDNGDFFEDSQVRYLSFDIGAHIHFPRN